MVSKISIEDTVYLLICAKFSNSTHIFFYQFCYQNDRERNETFTEMCEAAEYVSIEGSNMIFHSLTFARFRGKC